MRYLKKKVLSFEARHPRLFFVVYILLTVLFLGTTWVCYGGCFESRTAYDAIFDYPYANAWGAPIQRIAFIGDSLCPDTANVKKIMDHMNKQHPRGVWHSIQDCYGGSLLNKNFPDCEQCKEYAWRKNDIVHRMDYDVLRHKPKVIMFLWDSDATDIDEGSYEKEFNHGLPSQARVKQFNEDLNVVLSAFTNSGARVLVGGPGLYGELPRGQNGRDAMMDAFEKMVSDGCQRYNVTYFNLRAGLFEGLLKVAGLSILSPPPPTRLSTD